MPTLDRATLARTEHMTFRANMGVGRHGWLRLTPAYGVRLVRDKIDHLPQGSVITDPFSGTGTTPLAAAELGHFGQSVDVNPFLIWLGRTKIAHYSNETLMSAFDALGEVAADARGTGTEEELWQPNLFKIEKWWSPGSLHALKALRAAIDSREGPVRDLLEVALCRTLIAVSSAAFNHQSMSFKDVDHANAPFDRLDVETAIQKFVDNGSEVLESARFELVGSAMIHSGDSRELVGGLKEADLVLTSPPYVNRMSYIRELRPYMYWLRYLDQASDAGDLDWRAIGGTWGTATSKLMSWKPEVETPVDDAIAVVAARIAADGGKNGPLLARYVHKYHHDMWQHFCAITPNIRRGGSASYIIGNSTFYGHEVPAHEWYAAMLRELSFTEVEVEIIRKRNSNKALFEYDVRGVKP